jgi:hypothetical protein
MPNNWTEFVKKFAKTHNITYGNALSNPECSIEYKKQNIPIQDIAGNIIDKPSNTENIKLVVEEVKPKVNRGRPNKYATAEEARKAKIANTIAGAKRRKEKGKGLFLSRERNRIAPETPQPRQPRVRQVAPGLTPYPQPQTADEILVDLRRRGEIPPEIPTSNEISIATPVRRSNLPVASATPVSNSTEASVVPKRGKGVIDNIKEGVKAIFKRTNPVEYALLTGASNIVKNPTAVISGRNDYPPKVRKIISKYGKKNITGITLARTPLGKPLMAALQIASGNTFSQRLENTPYDKLFHLFACLEFADGSRIMMEKNEVINAVEGCKLPPETETKQITSSDIPTGLTFNNSLENTQERMGNNYFGYSAKDNNCQDFIIAFLRANKLGSETDASWVKQETKVLFEGNDRLRKIANTLTNIGASFDVIKEGAGIKKKKILKGGMNPENTPENPNLVPPEENHPPLSNVELGERMLEEFQSRQRPPVNSNLAYQWNRRFYIWLSRLTNQERETQRIVDLINNIAPLIPHSNRHLEENEGAGIFNDFVGTLNKINPVMWGIKNHPDVGIKLGKVTNNNLLPVVVEIGKPVYDVAAVTAATTLTGNPVLGKVAADEFWNKFGKPYDPRSRQDNTALKKISEEIGKKAGKEAKKSGSGIKKKVKGGMINDGYVTPPPTIPLTQQQGNLILQTISQPMTPTNLYPILMNILDNIQGGDIRGRFRTFLLGFNGQAVANNVIRLYDRIISAGEEGETDTEGAGLKKKVKGGMVEEEPEYEPVTFATDELEKLRELLQDYRIEHKQIQRDTRRTDTPRQLEIDNIIKQIEDTIEPLLNIKEPKLLDYLKKRERGGKGLAKKSNNKVKGMANKWITYVKEYAKKHNLKYTDALKDPKCKAGYKSGAGLHLTPDGMMMSDSEDEKKKVTILPYPLPGRKKILPIKSGMGIPSSQEDYIAELYNQANLGANGRVKL